MAKPRHELGKQAKRIRKTGHIPAVLYGYGVESVPIQVEHRAFEKVLKEAGESSLVMLQIEGGKQQNVLIHDVARNVLKGVTEHVDFYAVRMDRPIEASVPLVFTGEAEAVKALGGVLVKVVHELEIRALPKDLPHEIEIDIASLRTFDDQLFVRNVAFPKGVEALAELEQVIALVEPPRTEEELQAMEQPAEVSLEGIEVAGKKEKEEERAEGEEPEGAGKKE